MQRNKRNLKVYIRGAYGPGNLGDDVLLEICINILRKHFTEPEISVGLHKPNNPGYFEKYRCRFTHISAPIITDLLIYGGGGQFFEFKQGNKNTNIIQKTVTALKHGLTAHDLTKILLIKIFRKNSVSFRKSAALCLGLGPFENTSSHFVKNKINHFLKCDFKSVRDSESLQLAKQYDSDVKIYTDPTFLTNHWLGSMPKSRAKKGNSIGIILRKWDLSEHGKKAIFNTVEAAKLLISSGAKVIFISLYRDYDKETISQFGEFNWLVWNPEKHTPDNFIEDIAQTFDILISTRAHGVLLPAQAGVPSVVIGIEPKLKNIHKLLPNGTLYTDGMDPHEIFKLAQSCLESREDLELKLMSDVGNQKKISEIFLDEFESWIKETKKELQ